MITDYLNNINFRKFVDLKYEIQDWYTVLVKTGNEKKISDNFLDFLFKITKNTHPCLIPYKLNNKSKTQEVKVKMLGYFFLKVPEDDINILHQAISSKRLIEEYGVRRMGKTPNYEVYKSMLDSGKMLIQYKIGDNVIIQNSKDKLQYVITEIEGNNAVLTTYVFNTAITEKEELKNLIKID